MRRFVCSLCAAVAASGLGSAAAYARNDEPSSLAQHDPAHDKAAIEALEKAFAAAFRAHDVDAIMKAYEPGPHLLVFDVAPPRQHVGWEDYKQDWQGVFAAFPGPIKFDITDLEITTVGTVAYSHSIQAGELTASDGAKVSLTVRVSDVYRKIHGQWLIVQEHVSVPVDLATGKADLLSKP
jgi:ketosteroid isomerase-like protein